MLAAAAGRVGAERLFEVVCRLLDGQMRDCCPVRWLERGQLAVAALPEHFDLSTAGPIREQLLRVINRGARTLIVDMTATISCDHAGVAALARVHQRAAANDTELLLVVSAPVVCRVLSIGHIDRQVSIYPVLEAALAAAGHVAICPLMPPIAGDGTLLAGVRKDGRTFPAQVTRAPVTARTGHFTLAVIRDGAGPDLAARNRYLEETLGSITGSIFEVGLKLNVSSDAPPGDLRGDSTKPAISLMARERNLRSHVPRLPAAGLRLRWLHHGC